MGGRSSANHGTKVVQTFGGQEQTLSSESFPNESGLAQDQSEAKCMEESAESLGDFRYEIRG